MDAKSLKKELDKFADEFASEKMKKGEVTFPLLFHDELKEKMAVWLLSRLTKAYNTGFEDGTDEEAVMMKDYALADRGDF